jgi:tRNA A37 threonylcarbamoyltransferase TsaD
MKGLPISSLVVVGGVAANQTLRKKLLKVLELAASEDKSNSRNSHKSKHLQQHPTPPDLLKEEQTLATATYSGSESAWQLIFPPPSLCTDNGVMVAWAGIEKLQLGISNAIEGQEVIARWPIGLPLVDRPGSERK